MKSKRTCLFCPNPANSREHLWPDWILKSTTNSGGPFRVTLPEKQPFQFSGTLTVKSVCGECNNGWMSQLESACKGSLSSMMRDIPVEFPSSVQHVLSAWALKMAILNASLKPQGQPRFFSATDGQRLRRHGAPPSWTRIEIGRFDGTGLHINGRDVEFEAQFPEPASGYLSTLVVGHLVIQVSAFKFPKSLDGKIVRMPLRGSWDESLISIWPPLPESVRWPPEISITRAGDNYSLDSLQNRYILGQEN